MIEVALELNLDSFLIRSTGESGGFAGQVSNRALRFSCEKIISVQRLTDNTPTTDFEFLGSSSKLESKGESDTEFDERIYQYLTAHGTVDISKVNIASGTSGYVTAAKTEGSGEMGRMILTEIAGQSSVALELVLKPEEFDAVWTLTTKSAIRKIFATLVCFKLKAGVAQAYGETALVAGVLSSSLRMMPD